jgi:hypothetical protein
MLDEDRKLLVARNAISPAEYRVAYQMKIVQKERALRRYLA